MNLRINKHYLWSAIFLFVVEVLIAKYLHDGIIRPYIGDFLVVIFIYCFLKIFLDQNEIKTALFVLLFSYVIEFTQYFKLLKLLGLQKAKWAILVFGNSFSWVDMLCYTSGIATVNLVELLRKNYFKKRKQLQGYN